MRFGCGPHGFYSMAEIAHAYLTVPFYPACFCAHLWLLRLPHRLSEIPHCVQAVNNGLDGYAMPAPDSSDEAGFSTPPTVAYARTARRRHSPYSCSRAARLIPSHYSPKASLLAGARHTGGAGAAVRRAGAFCGGKRTVSLRKEYERPYLDLAPVRLARNSSKAETATSTAAADTITKDPTVHVAAAASSTKPAESQVWCMSSTNSAPFTFGSSPSPSSVQTAPNPSLATDNSATSSSSTRRRSKQFQRLTLLHEAAANGGLSAALIAANIADINIPDDHLSTPLHIAALVSDTASVKHLITAGALVNALDRDGRTPLHLAAMLGSAERVQALLAGGAKMEIEDFGCKTALHHAAMRNRVEAIKVLAAAGEQAY